MTRLTYLKTHWTPEDAHSILSLLDELRDVLWSTYGNDIIEHRQKQHPNQNEINDNEQTDPFDTAMDDALLF